MGKFRFHQFAICKGDGSQFAVVEVAVAQITGGEFRLVDFTHGQIEISCIAIPHPAMIQNRFGQVCPDQLAGNEFYPEEGALRKRYIGQIAMLETDIRKVGCLQFAVVELYMTESTIGDTLIRAIDRLFRLIVEAQPSDGFFCHEPFLE